EQIVCRRLDPAAPELELALAWARGVESPAINALLQVAHQVVGQPKSRLGGESRAHSHSGGSDLSALAPHLLGQTGHARTDGHGPGGAIAPAPRTSTAQQDGRKSIGTSLARGVRVPQAS